LLNYYSVSRSVIWPGKTVLKSLPHSPKTTDLQLGRPAKVVPGISFSLKKATEHPAAMPCATDLGKTKFLRKE